MQAKYQNWAVVIPEMTDAFLKWKYRTPGGVDDSSGTTPEDAAHAATGLAEYEFDVEVVDIYTLQKQARIVPNATHNTGAAALVAHGFIGAAPINPGIAISITTLELYRRLRLRKASFSVEAFAKVLCDYYMVSLPAELPCDVNI